MVRNSTRHCLLSSYKTNDGVIGMAVTGFDVVHSRPFANGRSFGQVGSYERIDAMVRYAVDPEHAANSTIADLNRCPRDAQGRVCFEGDAVFLVPQSRRRGNGTLLVEAPNRGHCVALRSFNLAPLDLDSVLSLDSGDGFLMRHGWCIGFCGWQWDVPSEGQRLGLRAPVACVNAVDHPVQAQLRIQPDLPTQCFALTDHHVGQVGAHSTIAAHPQLTAGAQLLVREHRGAQARVIERGDWAFARERDGKVTPDLSFVWLASGFKAGCIYDLLYTPETAAVSGAGLLALRDFALFARYDPRSPCHGAIEHVIGEGISQCGRALRHYLFLGLNRGECERRAMDGLLIHIAGARRGEFNHRYGLPSVQPTPSAGHLFPFADSLETDPVGGQRDGLLVRQRDLGGLPRIIYTDSSSEYWRGDASLAHIDGAGNDIELDIGVRRYLFSGTQHGPGSVPLTDRNVFGTRGANPFNAIDYRPLFRAALENLRQWVANDVPAPPSVIPCIGAGSAWTREMALARLAGIPALVCPPSHLLPCLYPLDLGPTMTQGILLLPAQASGAPYRCFVSALDVDGNERAGIAMPDITVPLATYTGWVVRHDSTGGAGQLLEYMGATIPFATTSTERHAHCDPRAAIFERYQDERDYLLKVQDAASKLVAKRHLLAEDVEIALRLAQERYRALVVTPPTQT